MRSIRLSIFVVLGMLVIPELGAGQALPKSFISNTVIISHKVGHNNAGQELSSFGTGFILFHKLSESGGQWHGKLYLITNKHVLPSETDDVNITIRANVKGDGPNNLVKEITIPVRGQNHEEHKWLPTVRLHPERLVDVAVVDVTSQALSEHLVFPDNALEDTALLSSADLAKSGITLGFQIYLLGYPDAIYDPRNTSPLMRVGIIASDPVSGYSFNERIRAKFQDLPEHVDGFLVDANVFPGSSGSMVVRRPEPQYNGSSMSLGGLSGQPRILGIIADSIPTIDDTALNSTQRMGLGVAFSSQTILDVLALF